MDEKNLCKTRAFHVNEINLIHIKKYQIKNINNTDILLQIYFFSTMQTVQWSALISIQLPRYLRSEHYLKDLARTSSRHLLITHPRWPSYWFCTTKVHSFESPNFIFCIILPPKYWGSGWEYSLVCMGKSCKESHPLPVESTPSRINMFSDPFARDKSWQQRSGMLWLSHLNRGDPA